MKCPNCGNDLPDTVAVCRFCGQPIRPAEVPKQKVKKKKGCLVALLTVIIIIGAVVLCIALFLPGFFSPKNLGVKTSKEAYESALTKLNYVKDTAPASGKKEDYVYTYGEPEKVTTTLTSEELTSFFNYNRPDYYPLKDVQVKINPDNTVEFSASMNSDYFLNDILGGNYSKDEIVKAYPVIKVIPDTVNIYGSMSGEIVNNQAQDIALKDVELMGVELPASLYSTSSAQTEINNVVDNFLESVTDKTGGSYQSIKVENGELQLDATLPTTLTRVEAD